MLVSLLPLSHLLYAILERLECLRYGLIGSSAAVMRFVSLGIGRRANTHAISAACRMHRACVVRRTHTHLTYVCKCGCVCVCTCSIVCLPGRPSSAPKRMRACECGDNVHIYIHGELYIVQYSISIVEMVRWLFELCRDRRDSKRTAAQSVVSRRTVSTRTLSHCSPCFTDGFAVLRVRAWLFVLII